MTLAEHALRLTELGYLAEPNTPCDAVTVLTANGMQFVTRAFLEDTPVAQTITTILPLPPAEKIAEVRASQIVALRRAIETAL